MSDRVEPQESVQKAKLSSIDEVQALHEQFAKSLIGKGSALPDEIQRQARDRMELFLAVKGQIYDDLQVVHERLESAKSKVRQNVRRGESEDGVLVQPVQEYVDCLELKKQELETLFLQDEAYWRENLEKASKRSEEFPDSIKKLMEAHMQQIRAAFYCAPTTQVQVQCSGKYTLEKLPMWGLQAPIENIKFEWPTQADLYQMPANAALKSLTFQSSSNLVSAVQCTMTTGQQSPVLSRRECEQYEPKTIELNDWAAVRSIEAVEYTNNDSYGDVHQLKFCDAAGDEIASYNPYGHELIARRVVLRPEQELVGVYGVWGFIDDYFYGLGFIVKVKQAY